MINFYLGQFKKSRIKTFLPNLTTEKCFNFPLKNTIENYFINFLEFLYLENCFKIAKIFI